MNGLQRLEQPLARAIAIGLVRAAIGAKKPGGAEDLAAFLGRTRLTGSPDFGGTYAPVQPVHQAIEKPRLDGLSVRRDTAHQRALVQIDEADMKPRSCRTVFETVRQVLRQRRFTLVFFNVLDPLQQPAHR